MTPKLKPLAEQIVLITGASSGIGLVTARRAAARGARVFLVARGEAALQRAVEEIVAAGGEADFAVADVGSHQAVKRAAMAAVARFGRIDTWVNNAGVAIYAKLIDTPLAEHETLFRTNYFGAVHGALTAIEHLRENGGALITVASIAADIPSPILGAYSASKHAVKAFVESLRIELKADRVPISVTLIKPSGIDTPIAEHAARHAKGQTRVPPPVYDPELVADAILDAAEHPRLNVTVGGLGRLQVLVGVHLPGLLARSGRLFAPLLIDSRGKPRSAANNLDVAGKDDGERSPDQPGKRFSLYGVADRHPVASLAAVGAVAAGALLLRRLIRPAAD